MSADNQVRVGNRLMDGLPTQERHRMLDGCESVVLDAGVILCEPEQDFQHVYFPFTAVISLVATVSSHRPLEMALIGNEGMLGATLLLGVDAAPLKGVVQGAGTALRMTAEQFRRALAANPALLRMLNRYLYVLMAQLAKTVACTRFHEVEARLAHCLLLMHDRSRGDAFHLTHQFLADMLGVRRSGVTIAAGTLQKRALISYSRGDISILNRTGLEASSCECYDAAVEEYARLLV